MKPFRADAIFAELTHKEEILIEGQDGQTVSLELGEEYKHFHPVAKCIGVGPSYNQTSGIRKGDWLLFPFHNVTSLVNRTDYVVRKSTKGRYILSCTTHLVQAVITEQAKEDIMAGKKHIDWESHSRPVGRKIFIKLDDQKELSDQGIIIPDIAKRPVQTGVVVAKGPDANTYFMEEEIKVGSRVLIPENRSGGDLPYQDYKKGLITRINPQEVLCVSEDGEWKPVGGRLLVEPIIPEYQRSSIKAQTLTGKDSVDLDVYRIVGSRIIAPGSININPTLGKVVAVGSGWSKLHPSASAEGYDGPINAEPGQHILLRPTYNSSGEIVYGNEHIEIDSQKMIMLQANFVDAIVTDDEFLTGYEETSQPQADLYRGMSKIYGEN